MPPNGTVRKQGQNLRHLGFAIGTDAGKHIARRIEGSYRENIFTSGMVGWPGIPHISDLNFKPVIDRALELPGFDADHVTREVTVGFARNAVLEVADKVVEAVKSGAVRHFFLVAGCDGAKPGRNYYTEFVEKVPRDCMVLTLACGKYRFFDKDLGDTGGIPCYQTDQHRR